MLEEVVHVPGYRLLVHPPFQRPEFPVFTLNERVILHFATPLGACAAGDGGGLGRRQHHAAARPVRFATSDASVAASATTRRFRRTRGNWVATFELGSTAILITEPSVPLRPNMTHDDKVKYGQPIFSREVKCQPCQRDTRAARHDER